MITPDDVADWSDEAQATTMEIWRLFSKNKVSPLIALSSSMWTALQICAFLNSDANDVDFLLDGLKDRYRKLIEEKKDE